MVEPWAPWQTTVWLRSQRYAARAAHDTCPHGQSLPVGEAIPAISFAASSLNSASLASAGGASFSEGLV